MLTKFRTGLVALVLVVLAVAVPRAQTFSAQIQQFWNMLRTGALVFTQLNTVNATCTGTCTGFGGGGGAPTLATYLVQTVANKPTNAQVMASLGTGLVINTTTTGVQSIFAGTTCTNQFARSLNASGAATCAAVNLASDVTGNLPVTNLNSGTSAGATTFWRGDSTWAVPTSSGVTSVAMTVPSGGAFGISGSPVTTTGTLGLTASGASGSLLYMSSGTNVSASALLGANALALGGGAAAAPFTDSNWTIEQTAHSLSSSTQPRCAAFNTSTQSINSATFTALTFDSEDLDVGSMHSTVSNTDRFTVPTGGGGLYLFTAFTNFSVSATGQIGLVFELNGTTQIGPFTTIPNNATVAGGIEVSFLAVLAAADYIRILAYQSSGGALSVGNAGTRRNESQLTIVKLW